MSKTGPCLWEKLLVLSLYIPFCSVTERLAWDSTFLQHRFASVESNTAHALVFLQLGHL